jgi:Heterokaryon incompatibility protein (HET)
MAKNRRKVGAQRKRRPSPCRPALKYDQLDTQTKAQPIRLLTLSPSPLFDDPLECTLEHNALEDQPTYIGLSYSWGRGHHTATITVNGCTLQVPKRVRSALRHLRHKSKRLNFWIDAVCINQADVEERNQQVRQMGSIYRQADEVWAWLGEAAYHIRAAFPLLPTLSTLSKELNERSRDQLVKLIRDSNSKDLQAWQALADLFSRSLWRRTWVAQEVALAKTVIIFCGREFSTSLDLITGFLDVFVLIVDTIIALQREGKDPHSHFVILRPCGAYSYGVGRLIEIRRLSLNEASNSLLNLLKLVRRLDATDPRDKIYGVLGLIDATSSPLIEIDYAKSPGALYADTTKSLIEQKGRLAVLEEVEESHLSRHLGLPSWSPDWSKSHNQTDITCSPAFTERSALFSATYEWAFQGGFDMEKRLLMVEGVRLDTVAAASIKLQSIGDALLNASKKLLAKNNLRAGNNANEWWRTIMADQWSTETPPTTRRLGTGILQVSTIPPRTAEEEMRLIAEIRDGPSSRPFKGRKLFTSARTGFMGLGPGKMSPGDVVVVLSGGDVPYVLHLQEDGTHKYIGHW